MFFEILLAALCSFLLPIGILLFYHHRITPYRSKDPLSIAYKILLAICLFAPVGAGVLHLELGQAYTIIPLLILCAMCCIVVDASLNMIRRNLLFLLVSIAYFFAAMAQAAMMGIAILEARHGPLFGEGQWF